MALRLSYQPSQHVPSVEGLRGYAVLSVFLYHCFVYPPLKPYLAWGWSGVDLFFVISGFLITGILLDTRASPHCLRHFYVRRVLRIFPLYYLTLAGFSLFLLRVGSAKAEHMLGLMPWFWAYLQNLWIAFHDFTPVFGLAHFWSLAVEEQFYLLWPALVLWLRPEHLLRLCAGAALLSLGLRQFHLEFPFAYTFTLCRLEGLMCGAAIALWIRGDRSVLERWTQPVLALSGLALVGLVYRQGGLKVGDQPMMSAGYTLLALFFGAVLVSALDQGPLGRWVRRITDWPVAIFLGRYSYGIYVFHWILHTQLRAPLAHWLEARIESRLGVDLAYLALQSALTLGASMASFHLVEQRLLRLKDRFAPRSS